MFEASRLLLDDGIGMRSFVARLTQAVSSIAGAAAIPHSLAARRPGGIGAAPEKGGILEALVDRPALHYAICLHESAPLAMAECHARRPAVAGRRQHRHPGRRRRFDLVRLLLGRARRTEHDLIADAGLRC